MKTQKRKNTRKAASTRAQNVCDDTNHFAIEQERWVNDRLDSGEMPRFILDDESVLRVKGVYCYDPADASVGSDMGYVTTDKHMIWEDGTVRALKDGKVTGKIQGWDDKYFAWMVGIFRRADSEPC